MTERNHPAKTQAARHTAVSWPTLTRPTNSLNAPPAVRAGTQSGGQALDKHTQREMSARFGHDFSSVRIHTDARAEDSATAFGANAYAVGSDIVFGAGKYTPGSRETERLLAHELTHVAQQSQLGGGDWGRMSRKGDASEREADSLTAQIMMGQNVQVSAMPGAAIARDGDTDYCDFIGPPAPDSSVDNGVRTIPEVDITADAYDVGFQAGVQGLPSKPEDFRSFNGKSAKDYTRGYSDGVEAATKQKAVTKDMPAIEPLSDERNKEDSEKWKEMEENENDLRDLVVPSELQDELKNTNIDKEREEAQVQFTPVMD